MPPPPRGRFPSLEATATNPRLEPIASTSRQSIVDKRQGRARSSSRTSPKTCWCSANRAGAPAVASTVALAALLAPLANASPVSPLTPRQTEKQRAIDPLPAASPTPAPRPPGVLETDASSDDGLDRASPSAALIAPAVLRKRVLDKWVLEDGQWVLEPVVTIRGRVVGTPTSAMDALAPMDDNDSSPSIRSSALQDKLNGHSSTPLAASSRSTRTSLHLTAALASSSLAPSSTSPVAPHGTPKIAAAASPSDFTIPSGWASTPRETNYYAVPVIVSMSVLVSIAVVGTVLLSVVWRRKASVKRNAEGEAEKGRMGRMMEKVGLGSGEKKRSKKLKGKKGGGKKGGGGGASEATSAAAGLARVDSRASSDLGSGSGSGRRAITRANSSAIPAAGRVRPRRRRARPARTDRDDSDDDEARTALTGSQAGSAAPETLTSRLQARLRRSGATPPTLGGPSTVFSRDLDRTSTRSTYSSNGHLSRTSSRTASLVDESASRLGQPLDREDPLALSLSSSRRSLALSVPADAFPSLSTDSPTSGFGSTFLDVPLPALGPPAYRPASSTVQSTTRHSIARVPVPRVEVQEEPETVAVVASPPNLRAPQDEQWHWPNEKPVVPPPSSSRRAPRRRVPPPQSEQQPEEPPADPSLYSAHLATDDKAVLARLREQASSPARRSHLASTSQLPQASAPAEEDDDVDEEGFERLPQAGPSGLSHPPPPAPPSSSGSSSVLPAPPRPVDFAFDYTSSSSPSSALDNDRKTSAGPGSASRRRAPVEDEQEESAFLPVYHARERILQMASAPPPDHDDDDEEQAETGDGADWAEVAEEHDRARWEGREEHAEV